jgi:hypothetical protein
VPLVTPESASSLSTPADTARLAGSSYIMASAEARGSRDQTWLA